MRIIAIIKRIILQTLRDKRTLALILIAPLLLITLVNYLLNSSSDSPLKVGVYNLSDELKDSLNENLLNLILYNDSNNIYEKLKDHRLKAFIYEDSNGFHITYENSSPLDSSKVKSIFLSTLSKDGNETQKHSTQNES